MGLSQAHRDVPSQAGTRIRVTPDRSALPSYSERYKVATVLLFQVKVGCHPTAASSPPGIACFGKATRLDFALIRGAKGRFAPRSVNKASELGEGGRAGWGMVPESHQCLSTLPAREMVSGRCVQVRGAREGQTTPDFSKGALRARGNL